MDVRLSSPNDEIVVEYTGLIGKDDAVVPIRVVVINDERAGAYCVLWQYVEGNLDDIWQLMWRGSEDDLHKAMNYWSGFCADIYKEYGNAYNKKA
jgi:hypothetical protein